MVKQQTADRLANPDYIDAPFISNHDTTRISAQCVNNEEQMKFAAGLMMMMPGSPFVYYGEELGMKSSGTKDENKRLPMYWSAQDLSKTPDAPQAADAVEQKFPSAEEQEKDPGSILQYYKNAIRVAQKQSGNREGKYKCSGRRASGRYRCAFDRMGRKGKCNFM